MDFYTHGTLEKGDEDRPNKFIILAHNSQIYQNHKSIELGIVVRRIVKSVFIFILLFCCCLLVVQQGYCSFVHSFGSKSLLIGNGQSIICTHRRKLDVICKHKDGSMAKETWDVKIVPQLNHDLFSFRKAMKEGWQMNGRWKEGGLIIELFKTTRASMKFDRMIPSGSSWLMGVKVQRVIDQAHTVVEPGKKISMWKFHQITGHTGELLLRPTAKYMKIELTGKLAPCEISAQAKIRQVNVPKRKMKKVPSRPGYRVFIGISSFKHASRGGNRHWL